MTALLQGLVRTGGLAPMARLRLLYVIHTTADVDGAATDGVFDLVVFSPVNPEAVLGKFRFPERPADERERAGTSEGERFRRLSDALAP
jgi:hypothetical protein